MSYNLNCKLGTLNIQAGSRHIYETDFKKLERVFESTFHDEPEVSLNKLITKYKNDPFYFISILEEMADLNGKELRQNGLLTTRLDYLLYG